MVRTWREIRDGADRMYFDAPDGVRLGYLDLVTHLPGEVHLGRATEFYAALAAWRERNPRPPDGPLERVQNLGPSPRPQRPVPPTRPRLDAYGPPPDEPDIPTGVTIHERPPDRRTPSPAGGWDDLAGNAPGAAAAAVAAQLRRERPVATLLGRLLGRRTDERAWRIGARGEAKTGDYLRELTNAGIGWYALHAVQVSARGTDIDHVLIGPAGVFTINTKHHPKGFVSTSPDGISVNRHHTQYAQKAAAEAARAGRLLGAAIGRGPITVTPVIAVVGAGVRNPHQPLGVTVLLAAKLPRWLRSLPPVLSLDTTAKIYEIARRSTTWQRGH